MVLTARDVMPLVLAAMPSFVQKWREEVAEASADEGSAGGRLGYLDASAAAEHAVDLLARGETDEVAALLNVVERLHNEGDEYVRELATIGYVEDLQQCADCHHQVNRQDLLRFLGPVTKQWWDALERFRLGQSPGVTPETH